MNLSLKYVKYFGDIFHWKIVAQLHFNHVTQVQPLNGLGIEVCNTAIHLSCDDKFYLNII